MKVVGPCAFVVLVVAAAGAMGCNGKVTEPANREPRLVGFTVSPTAITIEGETEITTTAVDDDADSLTYDYRVSGGHITGHGPRVQWSGFDSLGSYTVSVSVTDGAGGDALAAGGVVVVPGANARPVIADVRIAPDCVTAGSAVDVRVSATDPDGDPVGVTVATPGGSTLSGSHVSFPAPSSVGDYSIGIRAEDGRGGVAQATRIMVVNSRPVITRLLPLAGTDNSGGTPFVAPTVANVGSTTNAVLVGLLVSYGNVVDNVAPILRVVNDDLSLGREFVGPSHGGRGGDVRDYTLRVPVGQVVTGMVLHVGDRVDQVGLIGRDWGECGGVTGSESNTRSVGGTGGDEKVTRCSSSEFAVGVHGRSGSVIDALGIVTGRIVRP